MPEEGQTHDAQWSLDLPTVIAGQQHLLHIQIHRDAENAAAEASERGWQMRFAIHLGDTGEVSAQIAQRGASTGVMIWADDPHTASLLTGNLAGLRQDLLAVGLQPGSVLVRNGAPPAAANRATQHILDESR
ncbi:flagellar hook-length control protein FliK [Devosia aurantiaca]|uniref:Flagellar hook-length control protein FliK n=1 Tax=Devosia aurantiaca TaxID=2714858 RepID=A0A6M1SXT6_9HYPH|nr:flagellar hook-length control protein FliK [Devosia aurantiaca]NGP17571.1 flagellar hook-length control protein FliK [Devosia aurantiaca]